MRYVVLGAGGMAGHVIFTHLESLGAHEVISCCRRATGVPRIDSAAVHLDVRHFNTVEHTLMPLRPCVVVNCVAVLRGTPAEMDYVNGEFPVLLARFLDRTDDGSRLIQLSTDGVFSGSRGGYRESDPPDADDPYGRSKRDGEIPHASHLTIRTSIVGQELGGRWGLLEWLLTQSGEVKGFTRVMWNGVTTLELAKFVAYSAAAPLHGIVHLIGERVSKYDLLEAFRSEFSLALQILPSDTPISDRTLVSTREDMQYGTPSLATMLRELREWCTASGFYPRS